MVPIIAFSLLLCLEFASGQCFQLYSSNTICSTSCSVKFNKDLSNNSKTQDLLHEDFVKIQYKHLPYPRITGPEKKAEALFYNKTRKYGWIYKNFIDNDLEILNHFIFKGERDVT